MKHWYVVTPEYGTVIPVLDTGEGPMEYGADCIEVEADNKRDAIAFGVKLMLKGKWKEYQWCKDQRSSGVSPYTGVKAFPVPEDDDEAKPEALCRV